MKTLSLQKIIDQQTQNRTHKCRSGEAFPTFEKYSVGRSYTTLDNSGRIQLSDAISASKFILFFYKIKIPSKTANKQPPKYRQQNLKHNTKNLFCDLSLFHHQQHPYIVFHKYIPRPYRNKKIPKRLTKEAHKLEQIIKHISMLSQELKIQTLNLKSSSN